MTQHLRMVRGLAGFGAMIAIGLGASGAHAESRGAAEMASMPVAPPPVAATSAAKTASTVKTSGPAKAYGFSGPVAARTVTAKTAAAKSVAAQPAASKSVSVAPAVTATSASRGAGFADSSLPVRTGAAPQAAVGTTTARTATARTTTADLGSASGLTGKPYTQQIAQHARTAGVPVALALAVVRVESNFNPKTRGRAGEIGLMQIKPQTARGMGFTGSASALYDPDTNLTWGMKYLAGAYRLAGGDTCGTIMRYQGGHYARSMSRAAVAYCSKVKSHMAGKWA
jgi:soluble lytic murein transglycosylase-like protein